MFTYDYVNSYLAFMYTNYWDISQLFGCKCCKEEEFNFPILFYSSGLGLEKGLTPGQSGPIGESETK